MLKTLPYETQFGLKIPVDKVKTELFKYLSTTDLTKLQYEYVTDSAIKLIFIVGRNEAEKELPMFEHPLKVDNLRGGDCVVVDLRKFMKPMKPGDIIDRIEDYAKDLGHINFCVYRGLLTVDFLNRNFGIISPGIKSLTCAFGMFIANILGSSVTLTYPEILNVELAAALYFTIISNDSEDIEHYMDIAAARCSTTKMSGTLSKNAIDKAYTLLPVEELYKNFNKSPDLLIGLIKYAIAEDKRDLVTIEILYNAISSLWFGPGSAESMVIGLEHVPTWAALVYTATTDNTFKRARLSMIFDKYSKNIKPADYAKFVKQYMESKMIK